MGNEQMPREPIEMSEDEKARRLAQIEQNKQMQNAAFDASKRASEAAVQSPKPLGPNAITEVPGFKPTEAKGPEPQPMIENVPVDQTDQSPQ